MWLVVGWWMENGMVNVAIFTATKPCKNNHTRFHDQLSTKNDDRVINWLRNKVASKCDSTEIHNRSRERESEWAAE